MSKTRFLESGAVGAILVFCVNRILGIVGIDVVGFSISGRFETARMFDDIMWFLIGVYQHSFLGGRE